MTEENPALQEKAPPSPALAALGDGDALFRSGKYDAAAAKLEEAIGLLSDETVEKAEALARMGHLRMVQDRHADARPFLEKAVMLSRNPQQELENRFMLGKTLAHLGMHRQATEEYMKVQVFLSERLGQDGVDPAQRQNLMASMGDVSNCNGISFAHMGDDENAARLFNQAVMCDPQNAGYRQNLKPFLPFLKTAQEKDRAWAYANLALQMAGEFKAHAVPAGLQLVKEARLLWSANEDIKNIAASFEAESAKAAPAPPDAEQAAGIANAFNSAGFQIARAFADFDTANALWEEAARFQPDHPFVNLSRAVARIDQDKYEEAEAILMQLLETVETQNILEDPEQNDAFKKDVESMTGIVCSRLGRPKVAYLLLRNSGLPALPFPFLRAVYMNAMGNTLRELGRTEEAVPFLTQAVLMTPEKARREEFMADLEAAGGKMPSPQPVPGGPAIA